MSLGFRFVTLSAKRCESHRKQSGHCSRQLQNENLTGFGEDEFWLLSNALLSATIYE